VYTATCWGISFSVAFIQLHSMNLRATRVHPTAASGTLLDAAILVCWTQHFHDRNSRFLGKDGDSVRSTAQSLLRSLSGLSISLLLWNYKVNPVATAAGLEGRGSVPFN
jgi:hypothetical protein